MRIENILYIMGSDETLASIWQEKPLPVFSEEAVSFLAELSRCIRQREETKQYPDLWSFAFWCRRQNLLNMKEPCTGPGSGLRLGRGVSLHFVPSNIPLMFAYSMAAAILAGNSVVMRLPSRSSAQEQLLVECLKMVMEAQGWSRRIVLVRYEHQEEVTRRLSGQCDIRVIWGGNASVEAIRRCPLRAEAVEVVFPDRKSAVVLDGAALLKLDEQELASLAEAFYRDAYLYDQNSCASPSLVYWQGPPEEREAARKLFWDAVFQIAGKRYALSGKVVMEKWEKALELAAAEPDIRIEHRGNWILCVRIKAPSESVWENTLYGGFFIECGGEDLAGLVPALGRTCQTLSCFGLEPEKVAAQIAAAGVKGVDRIVPVGCALDFQMIWDGMDLIEQMSRRIYIS